MADGRSGRTSQAEVSSGDERWWRRANGLRGALRCVLPRPRSFESSRRYGRSLDDLATHLTNEEMARRGFVWYDAHLSRVSQDDLAALSDEDLRDLLALVRSGV